jgi:hypothetical protein
MTGISTGGDGMRLKLDIPESEMSHAIGLLLLKGKILNITIQEADNPVIARGTILKKF